MEHYRRGSLPNQIPAFTPTESSPESDTVDDYEHKGLLKDWIHHQFELDDADEENTGGALDELLSRSLQHILHRIHAGQHPPGR